MNLVKGKCINRVLKNTHEKFPVDPDSNLKDAINNALQMKNEI